MIESFKSGDQGHVEVASGNLLGAVTPTHTLEALGISSLALLVMYKAVSRRLKPNKSTSLHPQELTFKHSSRQDNQEI